MMMPMMMMGMMNKGKSSKDDSSNLAMLEALKKQNEMILSMNAGGYMGDSRDAENTILINRLNELEEKLASKASKTNNGAGGM